MRASVQCPLDVLGMGWITGVSGWWADEYSTGVELPTAVA